MATIKFSREAAKFIGAGRTWFGSSPNYEAGYGLWDTTASSAIFGGPAGTSTVHSVLNIYKGTVPTAAEFKDLASRESDLLVSFNFTGYSSNVLPLGFIDTTKSHRYVCGRHLNFVKAQQSGQATWFAAVNYREMSQTENQQSATTTWSISLTPLLDTKLFNEQINAKVVSQFAAATGTVSTLLSSTVTASAAIFEFSTATTGTVVLSYTATFFGGGNAGQSTISPLKGTVPAESFLYGTFTNAGGTYDYSGAARYAHYRRGAMIGTVGQLYSTADMQILATNIVSGQNYNCAGIFLNFPQDWTI